MYSARTDASARRCGAMVKVDVSLVFALKGIRRLKREERDVGASADELHANMRVRNACYTQPGPASTGVPVYGLAAGEAKSVIDLHLVPGWRA